MASPQRIINRPRRVGDSDDHSAPSNAAVAAATASPTVSSHPKPNPPAPPRRLSSGYGRESWRPPSVFHDLQSNVRMTSGLAWFRRALHPSCCILYKNQYHECHDYLCLNSMRWLLSLVPAKSRVSAAQAAAATR